MGLSRKDLDEQYDLGRQEARVDFKEQMRDQIGAASSELVERLEERLTQAEEMISKLEDEVDRLTYRIKDMEPQEWI